MKSVTVMSGPAIRKLKAENARLREQNRRMMRVLALAEQLPTDPDGDFDEQEQEILDRLGMAIAAVRELD